MTNSNLQILLVEDNKADAILIQKIMEGATVPCEINVAEDGENAMKLLQDPDAGYTPDIILLDLNMPKKDGKQVLKELKANESLKHIPAIMLTTSKLQQDVSSCYRLGASSYMIKPSCIEDHKKLVTAFNSFWLDLAILPTKG